MQEGWTFAMTVVKVHILYNKRKILLKHVYVWGFLAFCNTRYDSYFLSKEKRFKLSLLKSMPLFCECKNIL